MEGLFIIFLIIFGSLYIKKRNYEKSNYKIESDTLYNEIQKDKGKQGEYLIYKDLEKIKGIHKILVNVYLQKDNGETTEADIIYLHESGVYVFESKNFSGTIKGNEKDKEWKQIFKTRIVDFYNPILQNETHIKAVGESLRFDKKYIKSFIVFGNECKLKNSKVSSKNTYVIKRKKLIASMKKCMKNSTIKLDEDKIKNMYNELLKYARVNDSVKRSHIENIQKIKQKEY